MMVMPAILKPYMYFRSQSERMKRLSLRSHGKQLRCICDEQDLPRTKGYTEEVIRALIC